jgi:hypothetical protein
VLTSAPGMYSSKIWLEQDSFVAQVQAEQADAVCDLLLQGSRVGVRVKDRHP